MLSVDGSFNLHMAPFLIAVRSCLSLMMTCPLWNAVASQVVALLLIVTHIVAMTFAYSLVLGEGPAYDVD